MNPNSHIPHLQAQLAFAWHIRLVLDRRLSAVSCSGSLLLFFPSFIYPFFLFFFHTMNFVSQFSQEIFMNNELLNR